MNNTSTHTHKLLIGLVGTAGAGKDTVAELIHDMNQSCFVIVDVRTQPEVDAIHAQGGVIWRIERPGVAPASESSIAADRVIVNNSSPTELRSNVGYELARLDYEKTGMVRSA
ncbi:MAG: hypothetical protein RLZZ22_880 [Pseudomonadota bacterium]|jgi:broad-specificity NMP kinase